MVAPLRAANGAPALHRQKARYVLQTLIDTVLLDGLIGVILPFLVVLGVVIFVHEYGHYIVGRWCGIHAEEFSLGFGKELFGWTDRRGTRWRVSLLPLGGYVRFKGDADAASAPDPDSVRDLTAEERRSTLQGAPLWARALTVAAGPGANFLLSFLLFAFLAMALGAPSNDPRLGDVAADGQAGGAGLRAGDEILSVDGLPVHSFFGFVEQMFEREGEPRTVVVRRDGRDETLFVAFNRPPRVDNLRPGGPAQLACVRPGDVVVKIDETPITSFSDLQRIVSASEGRPLELTLERVEPGEGPRLLTVTVTPEVAETIDPATNTPSKRLLIGVSANIDLGLEPELATVGPLGAMEAGVAGLWRVIGGTFGYIGAWVSGDADGSSLRGPIGIAQASGETAQAGVLAFISFIAMVSTAIGLINLFPIPILDGGHLVFYAIEAVRGRPLGERWIEAGMKVGLAAILLLLVFATLNDVPRWFAGTGSGC